MPSQTSSRPEGAGAGRPGEATAQSYPWERWPTRNTSTRNMCTSITSRPDDTFAGYLAFALRHEGVH